MASMFCRPSANSIRTSIPSRRSRPLAVSIWVRQHVDSVDVGGDAHLGHHDQVELVAGLLDDIDDIAVHERGIEAVDPDRQGPPAPVQVVERLDQRGARPRLVGDRHRIPPGRT